MSSPDFRRRVRAFLDDCLRAEEFTPVVDCWLRSVNYSFSRKLGNEGFLGMTWPEKYGGAARPNTDRLAVTEELLRVGAPVTAHWVAERQIGPTLIRRGSETLKQKILPQIISGNALIALGMSEPESGSDLASIQTKATPVPGGWLLNGRKIWTTQAHKATDLYVLARTSDSGRKHEGLSEFIIDMDSTGISISPIIDMANQHNFNEITFVDVFMPEDRLIAEAGAGWNQVVEQLSFERGGPERALSTWILLPEALRQETCRSDEGAKRDLGVVIATMASLRYMYRSIAESLDAHEVPVRLAAASKLLGNEFEKALIDFVRALVPDPCEHLSSMITEALWASPSFGLRGGASGVLLNLVAKLELPRDLASVNPVAKDPDPERQELLALSARVADSITSDVEPPSGRTNRLVDVMRDLGWDRVSIPTAEGGEGGTLADAATLFRGLARAGFDSKLQHEIASEYARIEGVASFSSNDVSAVLDAAILVGASEGALTLSIRHVIERAQFGSPLARIPAVSSKIARLRVELDLAVGAYDRALSLHGRVAASSSASTDASAKPQVLALRSAALVAKATAARAGGLIADESHHLHGALGITDEYPLHHLTKIIWSTRDTGITEHAALVELGALGFAGGEDSIWTVLTDSDPVSEGR